MPEHIPIRVGIVTISDRASRGIYEDRGGPAIVNVPMRADNRTLFASQAATAILNKLNHDFSQEIPPAQFTSAEFALEMVKGVVKVNFNQQTQAEVGQ